MANFSIANLDSGTLRDAWPLVHAAAPELSLSDWQSFAEQLIDEGGGILVARSVGGEFHGLAAYRVEHCLRGGLTLRVEPLIAFDLHHRGPVRRALIAALAALGRSHSCSSLVVAIAGRGYAEGGEKSAAWRALGLDLESVLFARRLPHPAATCGVV